MQAAAVISLKLGDTAAWKGGNKKLILNRSELLRYWESVVCVCVWGGGGGFEGEWACVSDCAYARAE